MRNIWITSDTHLFHHNITTWTNGRPEFFSASEMNECILERWNSAVQPGDIVYHLGDVFFGSKEDFSTLWPQFHGSKRLVVGNHDDIKFLCKHFKKVMMWRDFGEFGLLLSHVPVHPNALDRGSKKSRINIHGHVHRNSINDSRYKNVCVEMTNYTPVHIDSLC